MKRILFKLSTLLSQTVLCEALWLTNHEIFMQHLRKLPRTETTIYTLSGVLKPCKTIPKLAKSQIIVERSDSCEMSPFACHAFHSFS